MAEKTLTSELPVWIDRRFPSQLSVELLPNLCVRLRGTPARLEELTRGLPREVLTHKPEGKWSIQENAGHLLDAEDVWAARLEDYAEGKDTLTAARPDGRKTQEAGHNHRPLEEILASFRRARLAMIDRVEGLPAELRNRALEHPRLKIPMRMVDHLFFVAEHDDQHLARILELHRQLAR